MRDERLWPRTSLPLSAEQRALLLLVGASADEVTRPNVHAVVEARIDPHALAREARWHNVVPLVCRRPDHLASLIGASDDLPDLIAEARTAGFRGLAAATELSGILGALLASGIRARAIKGPVAAAVCYGDVGLRSFVDLDILVDARDVQAAASVLESRGYTPRARLTPADWSRMLAGYSQLTFAPGAGLHAIDLHWSLIDPGYTFTPDVGGPFAGTNVVNVGPIALPTLGIEGTLLHLLLHGIKHGWSRLYWLCDVAHLLRRHPTLDWNEMLSWSNHPGRSRQIDVGLRLVSDLLGAPVPSRVLERGRSDSLVSRIVSALARALFDSRVREKHWWPETPFSRTYFMAMGTVRDRALFVHNAIFRPTPLEWREIPLPVPLSPLYYLVRPLRLLAKYAMPRRNDG